MMSDEDRTESRIERPKRPIRHNIVRCGVTAVLAAAMLLGFLLRSGAQDAEEIPIREDGFTAEGEAYRVDQRVLEIENFGFVEYKYRLEEGQTMVFAWKSSGPVRAEMHSQDDAAPVGTAEFFEVLPEATEGHGTYTAPFSGIHGWYWENLNIADPITVRIRTAGFFSGAQEFRYEGVIDHVVDDVWLSSEPEENVSPSLDE
jgi:hypothetical protein